MRGNPIRMDDDWGSPILRNPHIFRNRNGGLCDVHDLLIDMLSNFLAYFDCGASWQWLHTKAHGELFLAIG